MSLKTEGLDNYGRIMKSGYDEESFRNLEAVLAQSKVESLQQQSSGRIDRRGSLKKGGMVGGGGGGGGSMIEVSVQIIYTMCTNFSISDFFHSLITTKFLHILIAKNITYQL